MSIGSKAIIVGSACAGAALGYQFSYGDSANVASCTSIGAVCGTLVGGALALAKKVGPVAVGAVVGGSVGLAMGVPTCALLTVFASSDAPGTSAAALLCFFGACSLIPTSVGAIAGAGITKIIALIAKSTFENQRAVIRLEVQNELDRRAV